MAIPGSKIRPLNAFRRVHAGNERQDGRFREGLCDDGHCVAIFQLESNATPRFFDLGTWGNSVDSVRSQPVALGKR
jgi:hypothetical protein